ncbi:hypothetical protein [Parasphingorhabdus sp.]|uniref:hypothetical protein n=1 Tax=Parasphingorhabdus sp. TaxID=2709688 RepID=UPI003A8DCBD8
MPDIQLSKDVETRRREALGTWDNEGGAEAPSGHDVVPHISALGDAEIIQLRIRVIALENLMIAVLAEGSERQKQIALEMADYISPRSGSTQHPLTVRASDHMAHIVSRAEHFRELEPE